MFEQFPYTNFHEINLDWLIQKIKEIETGEGFVLSVNGQTGEVVLYKSQYIHFPDVSENVWNMTRGSGENAEPTGIQFRNGHAMQRVDGLNRYDVYDSGNQPPYPVTSVNGQTGAVVINVPVESVNGQTGAVVINIPVTSVNGQTGDVTITPPVSSVNGQTGAVVTPFINPASEMLYLDSNSTQDYWGISRWINSNSQIRTEKGSASLYIEKSANSDVKAYISFLSEDETVSQTYQLLTTNDIPSESGVLSINGQTGVITLYGNNMPISDVDTTSVKTYIDNVAGKLECLVVNCGTISSLPATINNSSVENDMVVLQSMLGTPSAQTGDWTVTTNNGSLTISGSISGSTTLTLYLMKSR